MNFYNENDPKAAAWLRELIKARLIPEGIVDERSIEDVRPDDLEGFTQCHFFAGIGGWSYALRLAGWPEDEEVWTASCPCQPFSDAGKKLGIKDPRHLWPVLRRLAGRCKPPTVFGEQVASKDGRLWLAGVRANMARLGYAFGSADLCAAGIGAPHIRQRLYWVANAILPRPEPTGTGMPGPGRATQRPANCGTVGRMGNASGPGLQGFDIGRNNKNERAIGSPGMACETAWSDFTVLPCRDGKQRRIESGTFPLAHGVPDRVGLLRGYGNAIVPWLAAEFIKVYLEVTN